MDGWRRTDGRGNTGLRTGAQPPYASYAGAMTADRSSPADAATAAATGSTAPPATAPLATTLPAAPLPDGSGGVLGRKYRALTLGIISVVSLIAFEASAVNTAMPVAARALDGIGL